jgi:hypothetical protein
MFDIVTYEDVRFLVFKILKKIFKIVKYVKTVNYATITKNCVTIQLIKVLNFVPL